MGKVNYRPKARLQPRAAEAGVLRLRAQGSGSFCFVISGMLVGS